jgi:hypothetical protein
MRLQLFAACEKVIQADDRTLSLITLLDRIEVNLPPNVEAPENASVPARWAVLAVWRIEDSDANRLYEQYIDVVSEAGVSIIQTEAMQINVSAPYYRWISTMAQLPVTAGNLRVKLFTREGSEGNWEERGEYPIAIVLKRNE